MCGQWCVGYFYEIVNIRYIIDMIVFRQMWYIIIAEMFPRRLYLTVRRKYMRKQKIYPDTFVISYLYQGDASEKMEDTLQLWEF